MLCGPGQVLYEEGQEVELYTSSEEGSQGGYDSELEVKGRVASEDEEAGELDESIASFSSSFSQNTTPAESPVMASGGLLGGIEPGAGKPGLGGVALRLPPGLGPAQ